jgi:hypothetical protein
MVTPNELENEQNKTTLRIKLLIAVVNITKANQQKHP